MEVRCLTCGKILTGASAKFVGEYSDLAFFTAASERVHARCLRLNSDQCIVQDLACLHCSRIVGLKYVACTAPLAALTDLYGFEDPTHESLIHHLGSLSAFTSQLRSQTSQLQQQEERLAACENLVEHLVTALTCLTEQRLGL